jgi:hypothetical protein
MRCRDASRGSDYLEEFWGQVHTKLTYLHGIPMLTSEAASRTDDVLRFLTRCSDEHFLDFVELIFSVDAFRNMTSGNSLVEEINEFLRVDNLPYVLTGFVWEAEIITQFGREYESRKLTSYPQVIRKDSEILHTTAVAPALQLLTDSRFSAANTEFLEALEDYRHGDFGDCLTKCGSAIESVLKIICDSRGWDYRQEDTSSTLLRTVIQKTGLEPFFEQPLLLIATIRNRLSKSHGAGTKARQVPPETAEYAVNATAAAIVFLVRAAAER